MTELNPSTQKAQGYIARYKNAKYSDILQAYGKPSSTKIAAFNKIKTTMSEVGGTGMRITGAGSDIFSCAYKLIEKGVTYLIYHTPCNVFKIRFEN